MEGVLVTYVMDKDTTADMGDEGTDALIGVERIEFGSSSNTVDISSLTFDTAPASHPFSSSRDFVGEDDSSGGDQAVAPDCDEYVCPHAPENFEAVTPPTIDGDYFGL